MQIIRSGTQASLVATIAGEEAVARCPGPAVMPERQQVAHQSRFQPLVVSKLEAVLVGVDLVVAIEVVEVANLIGARSDAQNIRLPGREPPRQHALVKFLENRQCESAWLSCGDPALLMQDGQCGEPI